MTCTQINAIQQFAHAAGNVASPIHGIAEEREEALKGDGCHGRTPAHPLEKLSVASDTRSEGGVASFVMLSPKRRE